MFELMLIFVWFVVRLLMIFKAPKRPQRLSGRSTVELENPPADRPVPEGLKRLAKFKNEKEAGK